MTASAAQRSISPPEAERPDPVLAPELAAFAPGIRHGFFTRVGGVSTGDLASLNVGLGSADDREAIATNRQRVAAWLGLAGADRLVTVHQTHSSDVVEVTAPFPADGRPRADAMVTRRPGLALGVLTADCGPLLFADAEAGVIAAAHAGWRGAVNGIVARTVAAMEGLGAARPRIVAVLGPTIAQQSYEVGPDFIEGLLQRSGDHARFLRDAARPGHALFDLPAFILAMLEGEGVQASWTGHCTYRDEARLYSFRRATHRGEPDYGRQIAAITLQD